MIFCAALFVLLGLSFVTQEFLPSIPWAYHARVLLVPVVFFASAIAAPFPMMLLLAFTTGFLWDARHLVIETSTAVAALDGLAPPASPTFGYSIVLYALLGSLMQGIRPLFRRGRWELPVLMSGLATALLLIIEHLWFCFLRGRFFFSEDIWLNAGTTALLSMVLSPLLFLLIHWMAYLCGYHIRYESLQLRRSW